MGNLSERYRYYSRKVKISSVLSPPFDKISELLDFFSTNQTLKLIKGKIISNLVDTSDTSFLEDIELEESFADISSVEDILIENIKTAILDKNLNHLTIEKNKIYKILYNLSRRQKKRLYDYVKPFGTCHIGMRRFFVTTNGDFHICERAGYKYKIGCLEKGFDYERIAYYYRKAEQTFANCKNCWAINLCERCWVLIGNIDEFTGNIKEKFCDYNKKIIIKAFKMYTQLLREDPDCLKIFKDVIIA